MKKGDGITIVHEDHLILVECLFDSGADYVLAGAFKLLTVDEGIFWLKGCHVPTEECMGAARTCQALREKEQTPGLGFGLGQLLGPQLVPGPAPQVAPNVPPWLDGNYGPSYVGVLQATPQPLIVSTTSTKGL